MFCPKCGANLPDGAAFCGSCGAKLGGTQAAQTSQAAQAAETAPVAAKSRKPLVIGIAAAAVVIAAALVAYFMFFAPYSLDERTFPDASVRTALAAQADTDFDGKISRDEAKALTSLNLSSSGVASLDGLDKFPNLAKLDLSATSTLRQADFSKVPALTELNIAGSALPTVDISMLANLQTLKAGGAGITDLDVSNNTQLTALCVDDAVAVTGVEETGVRAQYLLTGAHEDYAALAYDMNGAGGNISYTELEFNYDDTDLTSWVSRSTAEYDNSTYTNGKRYTYEDGRIVKAEVTQTSYTSVNEVDYDEKGLVSEVYNRYDSGSSSSSSWQEFSFDDAGKLVSYTRGSNGSTPTDTLYSYNDANQLTQMEIQYSSSTSRYNFEYDGIGRVTRAKADYQEFEFEYNDSDQLTTKRLWWISDGERAGDPTVVTFEYDAEGRLSAATRSRGDSSYTYTATASVSYDETGNMSKVVRHSHSESSGNTYDFDGETTLAYIRVFTAKDAADVEQPVVVGDPTTHLYGNYPLRIDVMGKDKQSVIAYQTCKENMQLANFVI